jgi:putative ABC transport system permease protein
MFIAFRDLRFARGRFALMASVVAMVALLMVLLTGLSTGLADDNVSAIAHLPVTHLSFSAESGVVFNQSVVTADQWNAMKSVPGVADAAPVGSSLFNGHVYRNRAEAEKGRQEVLANGKASSAEGPPLNIAMFGVEPGSFVAPKPTSGQPLQKDSDGVVVSEDFATKKGVKIGDVIVLDRVGTEVPVVGIAAKNNFGHVPVMYAPLSVWQQATFGDTASGSRNVATFVALDAGSAFDPAASDPAQHLTTVTRTAAFNGSPGFKEETGTLVMIELFLYVIAGLLVAAFFTVWTIQRTSEIGLLKALGARNRYVIRDALGQAAMILVGATALGVFVGLGLGAIMPGNAPFALEPAPVIGAAVLLVIMGLLGALVSVRRIAKIDPLIALTGATGGPR